jgi:Transposase, Mutator family
VVIGAFVRGMSMRDVESLCEQAGLGKLSKSTASRICEEPRDRYEQFKRRDLYEIRLVALRSEAEATSALRFPGQRDGTPGRPCVQHHRAEQSEANGGTPAWRR